jgi:hypothetical protein
MAFKISDIPLVDNSAETNFAPAPTQSEIAPVRVLGIPQSSAPPPAMLDTFGQSPWVEEDKDYDQALSDWRRSGQDALDAAVQDPDTAFAGMNLDFEADPETAKRTLINESWMELHHDEPPAPTELQRAVQMQVASLAVFNEMASTPEELYTLIKKDAGKRKDAKALGQDLQLAAYTDAMLPSDPSGGYAAFRQKIKTHAGYDPEREADYLEAWHETRQRAKEKVDAFREPLVNVWRTFQQNGDITAAAMDAYAKLAPEQRPEFMDALSIRAKALPVEERATFWANMGKQTGQAISDYGRNAVESAQALGMAEPTPMALGFADAFYGTENYPAAEAARQQGQKDFQMRRNFAADVRKVAREDYDPLKSAFGDGKPGFWENVAYQAPGVTGISLTMAVPVLGMGTMAFAMEGQAYEEMRGRMLAAGKTDEEATAIAEGLAPIIALPQIALEKVGFGIWSRKLPGFTKALDALGDQITNRVLRGTVKAGTIATAETGIELVQDSLVYGVQDLAAALTEDVPDVEWSKELAGTWAQAPEIFLTLLPLAILGATGGLSQESRNAAFASASTTELQALGITADGIAAIRAAEGPSSLATAVDTAMATHDPNTEEAKAAVEVRKVELASQRQAKTDLERLGYSPPTMTQTNEGIFVFDGDGKNIGFAQNFAGARRIIAAHTVALDNLEKDRVDALTSLMEGVKAAVALDPTSETQVNFEEIDPNKLSPQMAASYLAQVAMKEQAEGGTGNVARSVLGYSVTEMMQGALFTVNALFKGASITDAFHETGHGLRKKAHAAGTITRRMEASLLINQDTVYAGRKVRDAKGRQTGTELRLVPDGITAAMLETGNIPAELIPAEFNGDGRYYADKILDEGVSEIIEAEVLKIRKGQPRGKLGITRELVQKNLEAMARLNATDAKSWRSFFEAVRAHWGVAASRAIAMMGAERRGEFDPAERDAYLNKLFGLDAQAEHEAAVRKEFDRMMGGHDVDMEADDIPFSIGRNTVTATDADYMAVVEAGDMETAQRMVDEAAQAAGYDRALFHETHQKNIPSIYKDGFRLDMPGARGSDTEMPDGIFLKETANKIGVAAVESKDVAQLPVVVKLQNPLVFRDRAALVSYLKGESVEFARMHWAADQSDKEVVRKVDALEKAAKDAGRGPESDPLWERYFNESDVIFEEGRAEMIEIASKARMLATEVIRRGGDGIIVERDAGSFNRAVKTFVVLDPSQIKSADPVTRDADGNVIPLSQRFDSTKDSISFSIGAAPQTAANIIALAKELDPAGVKAMLEDLRAFFKRSEDEGIDWGPQIKADKITLGAQGVLVKFADKDPRAMAMLSGYGEDQFSGFSLGRAPDVWKGFPEVQWLVSQPEVSNRGGERMEIPDARYGTRKVNRDWYFAKGKGDTSDQQREKYARSLVLRLVNQTTDERVKSLAALIKKHPEAIMTPVQGMEAPNTGWNHMPLAFARFLSAWSGNPVTTAIHKVNTSHNTGASALERLMRVHQFSGEVEAGKEYFIVDDVSTTGATAYYLARHIAAGGGNVVGILQMGLTPRGEKASKFSSKSFVGDEQQLEMSEATRKALQKRGDDATLNRVVQALGIAYDWRTLTDALGRALATNFPAARRVAENAGSARPVPADGAGSGNEGGIGSLPAFIGEREAADGVTPDQGSFGFSLGPAQVAGILSDHALARIDDPRRRTYVMSRIARDFNAMRLQIERMTALSGIRRSKGDLRREAMAREELAAEEKIALIHQRFGALMADEDLVKIKSQPVHAFLADPTTPLRGRLKSKAAAIREHPEMFQLHRAGDYDGSDGVSRSVFGGQRMPDQAAQELYDEGLIKEPTTDALWEALLVEQKTVASMKELLVMAQEQIREAKLEAKQEANEWLATQGKDQEVNFSDKEEIRRSLRMLDAILLALPAEIRGKIGGYTQISMIGTDAARLAYLKDKLAKAEKELEAFLRVEYAKEWEELLKKAAPKTNEAGQRPTGSIAADAYDIFRVAEWAMGQSFVVGEAEADKYDAIADNPDTEIKDADLARVKAQMIRLTTNWPAADAARREQAVLEGDKIYFGGLQALAIENSRRRERLGKLRTSAIKGTGKTGARMEREAAKQADATKVGSIKAMSWEFLSFGQLVNVLFGEKSDAAQWFNARELAASNAAFDGFQAKANSLESLFDTLSGNRFDGEKLRHRMATSQTIKVTDALGVQQAFSEASAITFLLMWRQEDGKRHMQGIISEETGAIVSNWGWNDDSAASIERQLSREGKAVMAFLGQSYGEEYERINDVFRRIWNVSMPRHKMYAPLSINPVQGKADTIMDPVSGDTMGAGMTPGSLKNRSFSAIAQPEFKDAFQVFLTHARQMEHFIAYGEFSRDALGVINRWETRSAILAAGGQAAATTLSKWIDYFALGGVQCANIGSQWNRKINGMLGRISQAALVGRVSVLAMQSLQLAAASFKMPLGAFLTRFAKLSAGRLGWGDAINSDYIQRRASQMPPLVRDMLQGMGAGTPNRAKFLAGKLGETISGADALFTAGTYAIFYDYHLKITQDAAAAHREAERLTDQVAQPTRTGARSWLEVANQGNPAFRAIWNFSSDPRQKGSLLVYEAMRRDTSGLDKAGNVAFTAAKVWIIGGILTTLLRAISRDLRNDDDDEIFDERYWSPGRLALMAATGPLSAVPYLGGMVEASTWAATGQFMPKGGMLNFVEDAAALPLKWSKGKVEPLKDLETLATGGAGFSGTSAAAASALHIIRDVVGFIENLEGPD